MSDPVISVIIPVRPDEAALPALLSQLEGHRAICDIHVMGEGSRAKSLNAGAKKARGTLLWFLHADSVLTDDSIDHLLAGFAKSPKSLLYFDLAFARDAVGLVKLNQWGANLRSRLLGVPFGDQGLACHRDIFKAVGPYDEHCAYGEDHLFVWQARQGGVKLFPIGAPLLTSARTYRQTGWLKLTILYQYRWIRQALPEAWKLMRRRGL
ncbi:hypothetical protein JCM17844_05740 [Iodidimonas gelatinilytica]|uniref:Glycosyltransferase 2-like domain-containing protein n=1 Tax=Iodidimonas gelatinilytica TaxID=1236966 RepID=A0A5A7MLW0_9PROT|nr:glycosyltransferase [Iodidimonas gelatinilytica]GEQ96937.1 hypothetical protein JCM17844_05740 [Iodidimonas gelatinilytica]